MHNHIKITVWPAIHSTSALAANAQAVSGVNPGGDADGQFALFPDLPFALAARAGFGNDFPGPATDRAWHVDLEKKLTAPHLTDADTMAAGFGAGSVRGAFAVTFRTHGHALCR